MRMSAVLLVALLLGAAPALADASAPIIAYLELRDHVVTVHADEAGQRYTVHTSEGVLLGDQLTLALLGDVAPRVAAAIRTAIAGGTPGFIWAGSDPQR